MTARKPQGYVGVNHLTIGSDILAVFQAVHLPEQIFEPELLGRLRQVKPDQSYPIGLLLELFEVLDHKLGRYALVSMGWGIFKASHQEAFSKVASSARDAIYGIDGMYKHANRGLRIGGWKVTRFEPGVAELEKTTPHHCVVEEGILQEALRSVGVNARIEQPECFRLGAPLCRYLVTSEVKDSRWSGAPAS